MADNVEFQKIKQEKVDKIEKVDRKCGSGMVAPKESAWVRPSKRLKREQVKSGMEVGLASPNSESLVAIGTVQKISSADFVEVLLNVVLKKTTELPKPKGRMTLISHVVAHCITWPLRYVTEADVKSQEKQVVFADFIHEDPRTGASTKGQTYFQK